MNPALKPLHIGPLCFGQLVYWKSLRRNPETQAGTFGDLWLFPEGITERDVISAMNQMVNRHEALRTCYRPDEGPDGVVQVVVEPTECNIKTLNINGAEDWTEAARVEMRRLCEGGFNITEDVSWKATLIFEGADPRVLCFACHHIMTDLEGLAQLRNEFMEVLQGSDLETWSPALQPCERARSERSESRLVRRQQAIAYVESITQAVASKVNRSQASNSDDNENLQQHPIYYESVGRLETSITETRLRSASSRLNVTPHSLVLAIVLANLSKFYQTNEMFLALTSSNRFELSTKSLVCLIAQNVAAFVQFKDKASLADLSRYLHKVCLRAYRNANPPPMDLAQLAQRHEHIIKYVETLPCAGAYQYQPFVPCTSIAKLSEKRVEDIYECLAEPKRAEMSNLRKSRNASLKLFWHLHASISNGYLDLWVDTKVPLNVNFSRTFLLAVREDLQKQIEGTGESIGDIGEALGKLASQDFNTKT